MSIKLFSSAVPGVTRPVEEQKLYSDGTPMIKGYMGEGHDSMVVRPNSLMEFVNAMFLVDSLNEQGYRVKNLVLPYVPGARQDRINVDGDILFTAKSVARMINERNFDKVIILDPHSPVISALIDRCQVYSLGNVTRVFHNEVQASTYSGIIAPDIGAAKRAEEVAKVYGLPVYYGLKHRDVATGKLSGFSISVPTHRHYLVVDDICDGGGTFVGLGEKIKAGLATADLYVSHGIFSKGTDALKQYYKTIYTTDSLEVNDRNRVEIIPVVNRMMEMTR